MMMLVGGKFPLNFSAVSGVTLLLLPNVDDQIYEGENDGKVSGHETRACHTYYPLDHRSLYKPTRAM